MAKAKKDFIDLYLDNSIPKKRGVAYFGEKEELAIISFNSSETNDKEKAKLFYEHIEPAFRKIIGGVLEMPKFHYLGRMNREDLIEETFNRLIEKIHKFQPGMIGKNGQPVKAYSYFSTIAKNYILEKKLRHEKVLKHKADVETSIDLSILSEDTLERLSSQDKGNIVFDNSEVVFNETKTKILNKITEILKEEEGKGEKQDLDLLKIGYTLKYLINKWDKIDFMKKNEFMRILALFTGLKQQKVSLLFKKFKVAVLEVLNPTGLKNNDDEEEEDEDEVRIKLKVDFEEDDFEEEEGEEKEDEMDKIHSTEDFEIYLEKERSKKIKEQWQEIQKKTKL